MIQLINTPDLLVEAEVTPGTLTFYQTVRKPWVKIEERRVRHQLHLPDERIASLGRYLLTGDVTPLPDTRSASHVPENGKETAS